MSDAEARTMGERLLARMEELARTQKQIRAEMVQIREGLLGIAATCRGFANESEHESGRWLTVAQTIETLLEAPPEAS